MYVAGEVAAASSAQRRTGVVMRCGKVTGTRSGGAMMAQEARAAMMCAAREITAAERSAAGVARAKRILRTDGSVR